MPNIEQSATALKIVVALDIGTTTSRVSYGILGGGRVPRVLGVVRFPVQGVAYSDGEVPSLLYYDKSGTVRAAGDEVLTEDIIKIASAEGWTKAEWWKLHLFAKQHLNLPPLPLGKSAADILTDFIKYLFRCTKTYIQEYHPTIPWPCAQHSIEYILTYPRSSGVQQDLYRQAIERAGLVPSTPEGRSRVHILSEGEASLHFCIANLLSAETANRGTPRGVAIVDAGGGTIDLNMFSTASNPISYEELAPAECRLEGSVFVSRRAGVLLHEKLRGWEHSNPEDISQFTHEFDKTTKLVIESDQKPVYIRVAGRRMNSTEHCISYGQLKFSGEEATGLFKDSIDAIMDAFEQQLKITTTPITTVFLVGGFAKNDWLWSQLQSYFKDMNINICRPDNHITEAVAMGAVLSHVRYHDHSKVVRAKCYVGNAPPIKVDSQERVPQKVSLHDSLSRSLARAFMFARKHTFEKLSSQADRNPADLDIQGVRHGWPTHKRTKKTDATEPLNEVKSAREGPEIEQQRHRSLWIGGHWLARTRQKENEALSLTTELVAPRTRSLLKTTYFPKRLSFT